MGSFSFSFSSIISGTTAAFSTPAEHQQVWRGGATYAPPTPRPRPEPVLVPSQLQEFVERHGGAAGFGSAAPAVQQDLERTSANVDWLRDHRQELYLWFSSQTRRPA